MYGQYHYEQYAEYMHNERMSQAERARQAHEVEAAQNRNKQRRFGGEELNRAVSALRLVFAR